MGIELNIISFSLIILLKIILLKVQRFENFLYCLKINAIDWRPRYPKKL